MEPPPLQTFHNFLFFRIYFTKTKKNKYLNKKIQSWRRLPIRQLQSLKFPSGGTNDKIRSDSHLLNLEFDKLDYFPKPIRSLVLQVYIKQTGILNNNLHVIVMGMSESDIYQKYQFIEKHIENLINLY